MEYLRSVHAVTIKEAKARLNALVEAAVGGEQVVLMRGAKHVAAIVPISADEIELSPRLFDDQATRFWKALAEERAEGAIATFSSATEAVAALRKTHPSRRPALRRTPGRKRPAR